MEECEEWPTLARVDDQGGFEQWLLANQSSQGCKGFTFWNAVRYKKAIQRTANMEHTQIMCGLERS